MQSLLRPCVLLAPIMLSSLAFATRAQTPVPAPSFEVASIRLADANAKPLPSGVLPISQFPTNHFYLHNISLEQIIAMAYHADQRHLEGPNWMESTNYSIDAKVEGEQQLAFDQIRPLLQNLLAQRLGLRVRHESRMGSGFEMVVAKGGPKLQPSKSSKRYGQILPDRLEGTNETAANIASFVSFAINQPVMDHTGLNGTYDIKLSYAPPSDPNAASNNPDIFTAIQEQLGLKLEPAKVPVEYLVIDHVDRVPTEN
jgi:uncharacterized protein (TIGR03435 family)